MRYLIHNFVSVSLINILLKMGTEAISKIISIWLKTIFWLFCFKYFFIFWLIYLFYFYELFSHGWSQGIGTQLVFEFCLCLFFVSKRLKKNSLVENGNIMNVVANFQNKINFFSIFIYFSTLNIVLGNLNWKTSQNRRSVLVMKK